MRIPCHFESCGVAQDKLREKSIKVTMVFLAHCFIESTSLWVARFLDDFVARNDKPEFLRQPQFLIAPPKHLKEVDLL
jgi:hypothetical protein